MAADRDDDEEYLDDLVYRASRTGEAFELEPLPVPVVPPDTDPRDYVRSLFRQPLLGESAPPPAPTLRGAAAERLRSAGLFGEAPAADGPSIATTSAPADGMGPPSWKRPSRATLPTILGDDTAAGPGQGAVPSIGSAPSASDLPSVASSAALPEAAAPSAPSPLDHPDAQTGLALTAADALLRKGIDLAVNLAGGNPALARKLVEVAANTLAGILPEEFRASAQASASAAAAEAERRIGDNERATRTRAAIGTLANHRAEAEHDHTAAVIAGDRAKIAEARREAIDAWSAERRARGDGEAEINAGAIALERQHRKTALRHRLAQMDGVGIQRSLDEDEDAKADPAMAHEVAEEIRQVRRHDPARVAEATIEREIAERKRDGRIDTPEEESRERYKLRLEAQSQRGIPEDRRRILTNAERTALATEYLRIESGQGKEAADRWLDERARLSGTLAARFKAEVSTPPAPTTEAPSGSPRGPEVDATEQGRVEPAQDRGNRSSGQYNPNANTSEKGESFGQEAQLELRKRYPVGQLSRDALIQTVTDVAIRRGELPSNTSFYLWSSLAADGPEIVRIAAAHSIVRMTREAPELARRAFEPWQIDAAQRVVDLEQQLSAGLSPDDSAHPAAQREALRRVHIATSAIFAPGWFGIGRGPQALRRIPQIRINAAKGAEAQALGVSRLRQDLEPHGFTVTGVKQVQTNYGRTDLDSTIRTKQDHMAFGAEIKVPTARYRNPQRERQESLGNVLLFRVDTKTGTIEVFRVHPSAKSYKRGDGTPYEDWLRSFLRAHKGL